MEVDLSGALFGLCVATRYVKAKVSPSDQSSKTSEVRSFRLCSGTS
jgi:hypothetical protein